MDLFSTCTVLKAKLPSGDDSLTYYINTLHGRKITVAVVTEHDAEETSCETNADWQTFLRASGFYRFLPSRFRSRIDLERKIPHFLQTCASRHLISACPGKATYHLPDVVQFAVVWFKLNIRDIELAKIPECMRRHLFEHARPFARLLYGTMSWNVRVDDCSFSDGFAELFVENDIDVGSYVLVRHVGNFIFELFVFDKQGFSLNLAGIPIGTSNPLHTPDDFLMYVESSFKDHSYSTLFNAPSFLYVPKQTSKQCCQGFLRSCSDSRKQVRVFYGKDDACFGTGEHQTLRKIQHTFQLRRCSTLFFVAHGRGEALLLVISKCGIEDIQTETNTYDIRTSATIAAAEVLH